MIEPALPYLSGWSMTGAGGGGFMCLILKDAADRATVQRIITETGPDTLKFHDVVVDETGLVVSSLR
jgi:hypothetical protein